MHRIGMFSKISKTTVKTLRYYDEVGLLHPEHIDGENGYRYYTTEQLFKLHTVVSLRQTGFSIGEIKNILQGKNVEQILAQRSLELESQLKEVQDQLSRIKYFIFEKKEGTKMDYTAVIKALPECIVYSKKMTVPSYDSYFEIIPAIGEEIKKSNPQLKCSVPEYCFIVYLDGEYREKDINIEFCEAVTDFGVETGDIKCKKMESVKAVSVMHKGSYSKLPMAYAYTFKWIEDNGYAVADNPRESYIDGIWNKDNEDDWLTELQVPVFKK